ncbi:MAG: hypothetical protein ABW168_18780 [Sedimenticola sp.]
MDRYSYLGLVTCYITMIIGTLFRRAGIPYYRQVSGLVAEGGERLEAVSISAGKKGMQAVGPTRIITDLLMLHQGVIPNTRLPLAANCHLEWSDIQQSWCVKTDDYGQSLDHLYVIGDCARIVGARASYHQG